MVTLNAIFFTVGILTSSLIQIQGADKYTDGNRPYEFGFSIDGEQHRHEKKDERGLIMGEFGFITADGVYHVTVYATDEQGRFKILSMKNIRVKPYPTYKQPSGSAREGHSLDVQTLQQTVPIQKPDTFKKISIEKPGKSCSSCSIPTTTTAAPIPAFVPNIQNTPIEPNVNNFGQYPTSGIPQGSRENVYPVQQNGFNNISPQQNLGSTANFPANQPNNLNNPQITLEQELVAPKQDSPMYPTNDAQYPQQPSESPQAFTGQPASTYPQQPVAPVYSTLNSESPQTNPFRPQNSFPAIGEDVKTSQPQPPTTSTGIASGRTAKKYEGEPQNIGFAGAQSNNGIPDQGGPVPNKPTLISAQMQIVDKNTDIYKRDPAEKEGLPKGLTKDDMTQLLYTFNYTVGFHAHFEEGYRNGAKQGYYYITGRNGVRTRVDYVADENGFRPKITQEVLDLLSDDVPKVETEKDEKYGLKGYEFKWLYYPVETKGR